jgi:hypothetical protein
MQFFNSGYERDVFKGIQWLAENRGRFRQRVFDPIAMEINVADKK